MDPSKSTDGEQGPLAWALHYAAMGWRVFPLWRAKDGVCTCWKGNRCKNPGKHPRTPHGHLAASTDVKKIGTWNWPTANVGIATGNGLFVLDIDPRHDGLASMKQLQEQLGSLPAGPRVKTGGGGGHWYFQEPEGQIRTTPSVCRRSPDRATWASGTSVAHRRY
jgi:hypothetical protein